MPTENKRVAAYLPQAIYHCLQDYKDKHGLKGDSQAIIQILSQFFQVDYQAAYQVAYKSDLETLQRVEATEARLTQIESLLSELNSKLLNSDFWMREKLSETEAKLKSVQLMKEEFNSELPSELLYEPPILDFSVVPGQLELISPLQDGDVSDSQEEQLKPLPGPMTGFALSTRFGLSKNAVSNKRSESKADPEKFSEWSQGRDPDGLAWNYDSQTKLYYPKLDLNQVNPLPEGS